MDGTVDASTGLTHLGAREYDPELGRFISVDPVMDLSDPQQMHGCTYSNNNPTTFSDPSGLIPSECEDGTPGMNCKGYSPGGGCPGGCGTAANQAGGKAVDEAGDRAEKEFQDREGLSGEELRAFQELMYDKRQGWEVALEALTELLGELSGFNSIRDCFQGEGVWVCVDALVGIVPWSKIPKLIGSAGQVFNIFRKAWNWASEVARARQLMAKVNNARESARALLPFVWVGLTSVLCGSSGSGGRRPLRVSMAMVMRAWGVCGIRRSVG